MQHGKPYILFLLTTLFIIAGIKGYAGSVSHTDSIDWQGTESYSAGNIELTLLHFRNATNHDDFGLLPVYSHSFPINSNSAEADITLSDKEFVTLFEEGELYFEGRELISNDVQITGQVEIINRRPFYSVYILPLKKDDDVISGLKKFNLEVTIRETDARTSGQLSSFAEESVLRTGKWYRLSVEEDGIHRIGYNELSEMGINTDVLDPAYIRLFGNGNGMVPEPNSTDRVDDLEEIPVYISGEEDGTFDRDDYILFYGQGPVEWRYSSFYKLYFHENNIYTDHTYYFLNLGTEEGKRIGEPQSHSGAITHEVSTYDINLAYEEDSTNIIKSGKEWYGKEFNTTLSYEFEFQLPDIETEVPVSMRINLAARSTENSFFTVYAEGDQVLNEEVASINLSSAVYARGVSPNPVNVIPDDEVFNVKVEYDKPNMTSIGWLNYIELNATSRLVFRGGQLSFREAGPVSDTSFVSYRIESESGTVSIWDVTDIWDIKAVSYEHEDQQLAFGYPAQELKEFIIFDGSQFHIPKFVEEVENQNLHGLTPHNYVIISHPLFMDEAERLANHHETFDGLSTIIVTPQQIYNEFSSGAQDVAAIRDFLRMLYQRSLPGQEIRYVLFFGDASYDYKDRLPNNTNFVPTFQSRESLKLASSFVTDDFFVCFDLNEGSNSAGNPDIGYGRFPVFNLEQAKQAVDKVIDYATRSEEVMGSWRNRITFVADDGDNNIHLKQAEGLAYIVDTTETVYDVNKIYLDAYEQLSMPGGNRYPEVNKAIDRDVNNGALIVNYTGHGGELGWADERVLDIPMINLWENLDNMPVFVTATCEFSRFDDPAHVSAGELVFLNPEGAGIGLYTTTRLAYSQSNFGLNKKFYNNAFDWDSNYHEFQRMGDLIMKAKNPANNNIRNFVLLGDPALMLVYPKKNVETTSITNENGEAIDTLKALARVTIEGAIKDEWGNPMNDFNGVVNPVVYDNPVINTTLGNDQGSKVTNFLQRNKVLFNGSATVTDGKFSFSFVVPKDIGYSPGFGKVTYYAYDTVSLIDANGYEKVLMGGIDENASNDEEGPRIDLYINHLDFTSGDYVSDNPLLIAHLYDENGINTVSNGIGHDITLTLSSRNGTPIVLNDYYEPETDSYQRGSIVYPLGKLPDGLYSLTLKAWDVFNNSTEKTIEFSIDYDSPVTLTSVVNYPNPFSDITRFSFNHSKPGLEMDVRIYIYNVNGQKVNTLSGSFTSEDNNTSEILWDGRNEEGDLLASGLYIYRIVVSTEYGYSSEQVNKLMFIR